ncbi:hypothetical protein MKQ70_32735 [Chitinophaga sedimenti]|uniref:hypothetical protein n=1 Tax=Chitinophaga sedimenti TaxID=2033606 RepID=UPI0020037F19|nr:hypothetical protein [Chitinophaga sedimenti]MCK7559483.1 hypothetical protein [Chitinophaga sedimenti]
MKIPLIADLYIRIASSFQADVTNGIQKQDKALRGFCSDNGIVIRNVYQDACSGNADGLEWQEYIAQSLRIRMQLIFYWYQITTELAVKFLLSLKRLNT